VILIFIGVRKEIETNLGLFRTGREGRMGTDQALIVEKGAFPVNSKVFAKPSIQE